MRAIIETTFHCEYRTVVHYVNFSATMHFIAYPLLVFRPVDPDQYPRIWKEGNYEVKLRLLKVIPFGKQTIGIEKIKEQDSGEFILRDNGRGDVVRRWDHFVFIRRTGNPTLTHYADRIDIEAGILTPLVWIFAQVFYRWRQFRWKRLIKRSFSQLKNDKWGNEQPPSTPGQAIGDIRRI